MKHGFLKTFIVLNLQFVTLTMSLTLLSGLIAAALLYVTTAHGVPTECGGERLTMEQLQMKQPLGTLPSNSNATLQYVGLGVGIQNYSCTGPTAAPKSIGAIASIFDITDYMLKCGNAESTEPGVGYLKAYNHLGCQASQDLDVNKCQLKGNYRFFDHLGHHWFGDVGGVAVPFFSIPGRGFLSAQKVGDVPAPAGAFGGGKNGFGPVDWLFLPSDGSSRTSGFSEIYRINTAGGAPDPDGCSSGAKVLSSKYTAEYWYFK